MTVAAFGNDLVGAIRFIVAAPFVLLVPGLALTRVLFPRWPLLSARFFLLSIALSIATLVLGSILLDLLRIRLELLSWLLLLIVVTAVGLYGAARRGAAFWPGLHRHGGLDRPAAGAQMREDRGTIDGLIADLELDVLEDLPSHQEPPLVPVAREVPAGVLSKVPRISARSSLLLAAAVVVAGGAVVLSRTPLSARGVQGNTALWLLPEARPGVVRVGVSSSELRGRSYVLTVTDKRGSRFISARIRLKPGQTWTTTIRIPPQDRPVRVLARLFRGTSQSSDNRFATLLVS